MFYRKNLNLGHLKEAYNFLYYHPKCSLPHTRENFTIANNVKVYNLGLNHAVADLLDTVYHDFDFDMTVEMYLSAFEAEHPGYQVSFEGRSNGYLMLTKKDDSDVSSSCLPFYVIDWDYDMLKRSTKAAGENITDMSALIIPLAKTVRDFDRLCDDLRDALDRITSDRVSRKAIKYAVIHSTGTRDPKLAEVHPELISSLDIALDKYDDEDPFGYDFDEVLLIEVTTKNNESNFSTDLEYIVLAYKGGQPRYTLLEKAYNA